MPSAAKRAVKGISVLLVDDHPLWRDTLRKVLERKGFATVVAEAADAGEALAAARASAPDVIVMDIQLPGASGIDATRDLVSERPDVKVLVLASSDNRAQVVAAVEAGARGYLIKTAGSDDVRESVRRVHEGELVFPPALASVVIDRLRGGDDGPADASR
ncbi:MAG TPA: response regulator transcription factor, partial [Actinomycetota bacterium]|nr:response regulator transcription factor [Actinomycetota bacterium]